MRQDKMRFPQNAAIYEKTLRFLRGIRLRYEFDHVTELLTENLGGRWLKRGGFAKGVRQGKEVHFEETNYENLEPSK